LALDLSTSTGWAFFLNGERADHGGFKVEIENFNVQKHPEKQLDYPGNIARAASQVAANVGALFARLSPDFVVIENTVCGRNRGTQRCLEWIHLGVLHELMCRDIRFRYMDPSEWRAALQVRLSKDDKRNNRHVYEGKKRGRIGRKHLSVRYANETFGLKLKLKDNDRADALCLGKAFIHQILNQHEAAA
jgi:hypothetical protein